MTEENWTEPSELIVEQIEIGPMQNFTYLIGCRSSTGSCRSRSGLGRYKLTGTHQQQGLYAQGRPGHALSSRSCGWLIRWQRGRGCGQT